MSNTISIPGGRQDAPFIMSRVQRNNRLRTTRRIQAITDRLSDPTLTAPQIATLEAERTALQERHR